MPKSKAEYIVNYCNAKMARTHTPAIDADMIFEAIEEYTALATMVNGFQFRASRYDNPMP
jgi:hypothetical protein